MDEFLEMLDGIAGEMPEDFFKELNGGILLQSSVKLHPAAKDDDLYILGEYHQDGRMGKYINIYYGSFMQVCGHLSGEKLRKRIRKTVLHEFRHHLEGLSGERGLEVEDAIQIARYKENN